MHRTPNYTTKLQQKKYSMVKTTCANLFLLAIWLCDLTSSLYSTFVLFPLFSLDIPNFIYSQENKYRENTPDILQTKIFRGLAHYQMCDTPAEHTLAPFARSLACSLGYYKLVMSRDPRIIFYRTN